MSCKRKRIVLSLSDKTKILKRLKNGESGSKLAAEYGVGKSTVSELKKNEESVMNYVSVMDKNKGNLDRKCMKKSSNDEVDKALYLWFLQKRSLGQPISGHLLCEKALFFHEKFGGNGTFQASSGWLRNFKHRHGIRELEIHGEKLSASTESASNFVKELESIIETEGYEEEFIYNADESGLNWKSLPRKTLASGDEKHVSGNKIIKERVTINVCANATGNHRIPLMMIGKSKNPRAFKNVKTLPVIYASQNKAWMNTSIFIEWYDKTFIPNVKKYQKNSGKTGKVLLILDNAPSHPNPDLLDRENGMFRVVFLPPNVTPLIQPMDQSVIETLKRLNKKQLLRKILLSDEQNEGDFRNSIKAVDLKDCCMMIADAWNSVKTSTLRKSWNKILNRKTNETEVSEPVEFPDEKMPGYTAEEIEDWCQDTENDPGFQILNDEEIVTEILNENRNSTDEEEEVENQVQDCGPSHIEACNALDIAMNWLERQNDADPVQLIYLKRIRDMAAQKRVSSLKQKSLLDFFGNGK